MTKSRSITLWGLLVAALWTASISMHVDSRSAAVPDAAEVDGQSITMGIRN